VITTTLWPRCSIFNYNLHIARVALCAFFSTVQSQCCVATVALWLGCAESPVRSPLHSRIEWKSNSSDLRVARWAFFSILNLWKRWRLGVLTIIATMFLFITNLIKATIIKLLRPFLCVYGLITLLHEITKAWN